jgi:hypothetical protein
MMMPAFAHGTGTCRAPCRRCVTVLASGPTCAVTEPLPAQEPAQPHDALGVHAVERLVEQQRRGVAEHGRGHPEPLPHAQGVAARPAAGDRGEPGELEDLADAGRRKALGGREPPQVAASRTARLEGAGVEQRPGVPQRVLKRPVGTAADQGRSGIGAVEAEDDAHRGGLARAVRPGEARDPARGGGEGHAVQRLGRPVPFAELFDFDHADRSTPGPVSPRCRRLTPG